MEPEQQRIQARERWEAAAEGWAHADFFDRAVEPVAKAMVDAIQAQPGHVVLELAAGRGTTGFMAVPLIAPAGTLITTDGADAMVKAAEARGAELGVEETEYRRMELEWLDLETASVDAILCRFGYMLAVDPEAALREARRVLRPDGRIALATWAAPEHNPWLAAPRDELAAGSLDGPGPFALSDPVQIQQLLDTTGFMEIDVTPVDITFEAESLDRLWEEMIALSTTLRPQLDSLSPADHFRLRDRIDANWSQHLRPGPGARLPGRALVASASA
jgi:ubiquinone/menaquinone biosynthesis C-methylase UbiE